MKNAGSNRTNPSLPYFSFNNYLKKRFRAKVYRICVDAGFSCPTRDGTKGYGGCIYCDSYGSGNRMGQIHISKQIKDGMEYVKRRYGAEKFLLYFQAFTNTYKPVDQLKVIYDNIKFSDDIIGLIIGTRPDCIDIEKIKLIDSYTKDYEVWVELGLQSSNPKTLEFIKRGHTVEDFINTIKLIRQNSRNIKISTHIILGLPTDTEEDIMQTINLLNNNKIDGIKFHMLYIARETELERIYREKKFTLLQEEEYVDLVIKCLEQLAPEVVVQRLVSEASDEILVEPLWLRDKNRVIEKIRKKMWSYGTFQGRLYSPG